MKKITTILASLFIAFGFISCNDETLQTYLVKSQEKSGFITFDVPASILQIKSDDVSEETKATLKTLKKIKITFILKNIIIFIIHFLIFLSINPLIIYNL